MNTMNTMNTVTAADAADGKRIEIREMNEADRGKLAEWLTRIAGDHGVNGTFPASILPWTGLAAVDEAGNTLAVAALYLERSSTVAVFGFCVGAPEKRFSRRSGEAVKRLIAAMPAYAKQNGAEILMSVFGRRSLNRLLDKAGFIPGETAETKFRRV